MIVEDLHAGIARLFPSPGFIVLSEVRNATGFDATRSADCLALGMYKSRGRELWGFEMKVSRSDWLKELEQPQKAEAWLRYCDRWALVISDASFVREGELPEAWGLYAPVKGRLKCIKPCPKLDADPLDRVALAALVYAVAKRDEGAFQRARDEAFKKGKESQKQSGSYNEKRFEELELRVREFEAASGISIHWNQPDALKDIGNLVREIRTGERDFKRQMHTVRYAIKCVEDMLPNLQKQLAVLESAPQFEDPKN